MQQVLIGKARISLVGKARNNEGRTVYHYSITLPNSSRHENTDLCSGCGGGTEREGMGSLLTFLGACAESYPDGENADLFPRNVAEWAAENSDEITSLSCEYEN